MRNILILACLFGFSQTLPTTAAANVTTVAASRPTGSTSSLKPTTTSSRIYSSAQTTSLKTSPISNSSTAPTSVSVTTTWSVMETTSLSQSSLTTASSSSSANATTQLYWTLIVAIPTVVGFTILVVVIVVVVFLVVRSKNKQKIRRLSRRVTVLQKVDRSDPYNVSRVPTTSQSHDRDIQSKNVDVVSRQTRPSVGAAGVRLDVPSHEMVYANQRDMRDSSYLNANEIEMFSKSPFHNRNEERQISKDESDRRDINNAKKEFTRTSSEEDEDNLYLNHVQANRPSGKVCTPHWTDDDLRDSVYANHMEMRGGEGKANSRPESVDSCNYLNERDMEMLRRARPDVSSIYAPRM